MSRGRLFLFCDMHGHSRKKNVFMFGCENSRSEPALERVFPLLLSRRSEDFSFADCTFKVNKSKTNCGRVAVRRDIGLLNSFTLEASLCGTNIGTNRDMHFRQLDLERVGRRFAETLLDMADPDQAAVQAALVELKKLLGDRSNGGIGDAGGDRNGEATLSTKEERKARRKGSKGRRKRRV